MLIVHPVTGKWLRCGKVLCVARNYAKHAAEMNAKVPAAPVIFLKPATALVPSGSQVVLPAISSTVHHELELVVLIGRSGKDIGTGSSLQYVAGYAVGLDMTARDLQAKAKAKGQPWSVAKGFDTFAPLGNFTPAGQVQDVQALTIELSVNGQVRQEGNTSDMIFSVVHLVAWCSRIFTLEPGDVLFTGTPDGVGPVLRGDVLEASGTGLEPLKVTVA